MVVTGKGMWTKPNANIPQNRGYDILPDQCIHQLLTTGAGSFLNSLDPVSATILCSGKIMCESLRGFAKEKGVRDKGQKDLGNAKVATLLSDASLSEGVRLARAK